MKAETNTVQNEKAKFQISLRSDSMNDFFLERPGFFERWLLGIIMLIMMGILSLCYFIHYPDIIKSRFILISETSPKEVISREDGRLIKLFVSNGQEVVKGQVVGFIESTASHEQIIKLSLVIDSCISDLEKDSTRSLSQLELEQFNGLGENQPGFQKLMTDYRQLKDFIQGGYYVEKRKILFDDIAFIHKNLDVIERQKKILLNDLGLSEENYKATSALLKEKVLSLQDDRLEKSKLFGKQLTIEQVNANLLNNKGAEREKWKEIKELDHTLMQQKAIFLQSLYTFRNVLSDWSNRFILKSFVAGKITLFPFVQENQFLKSGKVLAYISSENSDIYAQVNLRQFNAGKVANGQRVILQFDSYPFQEYGHVTGKINSVSDLATDSGFIVRVTLPNGLTTNINRSLLYKEGLSGEAHIITKDIRLLEHFYYNTFYKLNR